MSTGERFRGSGARSITRFLAEHQACDAGFEVGRDVPGSGKLQIVCKGCGAVGDYTAASAAALPAGLRSPPERARRAAAEPSRSEPPPRPPRRRGRPWAAPAAIAALVVAGAVLIAIGVLAQENEDSGPPDAEQPPAQVEPAPQQPDAVASARAAAERAARLREKIRLQGQVFSDRFSIGVPPSWSTGSLENGGTGLFSSDGQAAVRVYYEVGGADVRELARGAARFLEDEHPAARVGPAVPKRIGSLRGRSVTAEYPGGRERAVVLSSDGVSYLLLEQVEEDATPFRQLQANAALRSFRPL